MNRITLGARDRRLLLGYGPGLFLAAAFLLMAALVPTVAPEHDVAAQGTQAIPSAGAADGLPQGLATGAGTAPQQGASGSARSRAGSAGGTGGTGGAADAGGGGSSGGGGGSGTGHLATCSGKQVHGDPYSPPCISFSGANGGATSPGVTGTTITVTYRTPADAASATQAVEQLAGKYNSATFSDTPAQTQRTVEDLVKYFNAHFQFYGRKIVLKPFDGSGLLLQEVLDSGQSGANADALTASRTYHAFADVSATTQPYAEALSAQHIVNVGAAYMSDQWFRKQAPYSWSYYPNCTDLAAEASVIITKQVLNQKVTWAGKGVKDGVPRKYALLVPDNPVYQQCAQQVAAAMSKAGHPVAANLSYSLDLSQMSAEANSVEQQIVNDGITTVLFGGDPIMLVYLTSDLSNADYQPEFLNIGAGYTDEDVVGQLFDQSAWSHAAGVTNNGVTPPYGSSLGYFAVKSVDPGFAPAHFVDIYYEDLYTLALGIQLAGPDLTPANFEKGMFAYGGGNGEYGPWSFQEHGQGVFTNQHAFRYEWWNPRATSAFNSQPGAWVSGSKWYTTDTVPNGPSPVFPNGPQ